MEKIATYLLVLFFFHDGFASEVSLNLMWMNREINNDELLIFPEIRKKEKYRDITVLSWIEDLLRANAKEDVEINFWYDSQNVTEQQIHNTESKFNYLHDRFKKRINLFDINDLDLLQRYRDLLRESGFYLRVDIIKIFIVLDRFNKFKEKASYKVVFYDVDKGYEYSSKHSEPTRFLSARNLLTANVLDALDKYGLIMNGASGYNENNFFIAQSNISEALQTAVVDANRVRLIKLIAQRKKIVQEILVHNPDFPVVNDSLESTIFTDLQNFKRYQREENVAIYKNKLRQNIVRKYDTIPIDLIIRSRDIYFIENGVVYESMLSDVSCYHSFLMQSAKMPAEDLIHETHRAMFLSKQDGQENYRLIFPEILAAFETERLPDLFNTELLSKCAPGSIRIRGSRSTSTLDVMKLFSFIAEEKENGETINEYCKQSSTRPLNYINL